MGESKNEAIRLNYNTIIIDPEYKKKGWIKSSGFTYFWSGENAIYIGDRKMPGSPDIYEGLGLIKTEADMREKLRLAYNSDLADVISNTTHTEISFGFDADSKIKWLETVHFRIKH